MPTQPRPPQAHASAAALSMPHAVGAALTSPNTAVMPAQPSLPQTHSGAVALPLSHTVGAAQTPSNTAIVPALSLRHSSMTHAQIATPVQLVQLFQNQATADAQDSAPPSP
jgi:hypothetical protein